MVMQQGADILPLAMARREAFALDDPNRVVRSLWIGKLSPLERLCMESFVRQGHEFQVFMYEPADDLPPGVVVRDAAEILPAESIRQNQLGQGKGSFAAFADLFRYRMLHDLGGWWVDMDVFCLRPFTFAAPYVLGAEDKPVANGVIKVPPGCELMRRICEDAAKIDLATVLWNETGDIVGQAVADLELMHFVLPAEVFSPIVWHELPAYVRGKKRFQPLERSHAVHLYHEMWRRKKLNKWVRHGRHSVVEILKRHAGMTDPRRTGHGWTRWLPWRRAA
jgi:Glycosyltransferase sugar-binding region containing DXD motif